MIAYFLLDLLYDYLTHTHTCKYCHVFYLHVATINVDSPDLTRKFIGTIVEITHNRCNTQFRVL
jgi:hypothetical protein